MQLLAHKGKTVPPWIVELSAGYLLSLIMLLSRNKVSVPSISGVLSQSLAPKCSCIPVTLVLSGVGCECLPSFHSTNFESPIPLNFFKTLDLGM
jgi:hypothetical protein